MTQYSDSSVLKIDDRKQEDVSAASLANVQTFDQYYNKPRWWFLFRYDTQIKKKTILALVKHFKEDCDGKKIFELGFGSAEVLLSFPRTCELYGAELSSTAVDAITRRVKAKRYFYSKFVLLRRETVLDFEEGTMDLAIASHVFEHVPDDVMCLREVKRILKPGGLLVVLIPINERYPDPNHVRRYSAEGFRTMCEKEGFSFVNGFENEFLYYLVERLYRSHNNGNWGVFANILRAGFNIAMSRFPFWVYRLLDSILQRITGLPPRQAALLLKK